MAGLRLSKFPWMPALFTLTRSVVPGFALAGRRKRSDAAATRAKTPKGRISLLRLLVRFMAPTFQCLLANADNGCPAGLM